MTELQEMFAGLDDADVEGRLPKLEDGQYICEISATKKVKGYNSGQSFVIEMKIVECLTPSIAAKYPPGREVSATINRLTDPKSENRGLALGNLKMFLAAAFSFKMGEYFDPESAQKWEQLATMCVQQETLLAGCQIRVQVDTIDTKGGRKFAKHAYRALNAPTAVAA